MDVIYIYSGQTRSCENTILDGLAILLSVPGERALSEIMLTYYIDVNFNDT